MQIFPDKINYRKGKDWRNLFSEDSEHSLFDGYGNMAGQTPRANIEQKTGPLCAIFLS